MEPGWVLWSGTLGLESDITSRIDAAVACGYSRVSVSPLDIWRSEEAGVSAREVGRHFAESGLGVVVDPIMNWFGGTAPSGSRFARFTADEALRMCEDLGAVSATAIGQAAGDRLPSNIADHFGALCDRAAEFGMDVHLEFTAIHSIGTLQQAWDIVRDAERANGGLLLDTWHFFRTGADFELLAEIPGERILAVQVDDGLAEVVGTMRDDTLNRLLPGDGSFDLVGVMSVLERIAGLAWVGPEVISPVTAAMEPQEAARRALDSIKALLAEVAST